ncbi:phosphonatase-like hydrolase [Chitinophaga skermanii]|uniref:Phosphonatase-like hydrolase n=1 Tax=Chitinophaga skermanii TaxID=331697 RepID=A0A327QZK1_9BACT|nr:phosphonatase-like hydrolase [Chitinophaga skermanii]RAJ08873.1 phosphonatase-like hydrolase [Chitinophaga skermanii]
MIKMVVFDMAGTTLNEDNVVYKTVQSSINQAGFNVSLDAVLAAGAGKEKLQAIKSVLADMDVHDDNIAQNIFSHFNESLHQAYQTLHVTEQNNASHVFNVLKEKGITVVLNTGYSRAIATMLLAKLGWVQGTHYDLLITASDVAQNRPHPDMIFSAMQQAGIENGAAVIKVGDSTIDVEEGRNAGCDISIGITTGAHTKEQLANAQPSYIIDDLSEILTIIQSHPYQVA